MNGPDSETTDGSMKLSDLSTAEQACLLGCVLVHLIAMGVGLRWLL